MERPTPTSEVPETTGPAATGTVHVHYWASAKAAAEVAGDELEVEGALTLAEVVRRVLALHPGSRLPEVLATCSALVGDRPVGASDPEEVSVAPGQAVEFLPPFAGG